MDRHFAEEIIACLPSERTLYYYYKDRYSIALLHHLSSSYQKGLSVAALKASDYAPLLQKPRIKNILSGLGHQLPDPSYWTRHDYDQAQETFILTLGLWGDRKQSNWRWQQTSRPGCNLVLQMNFSRKHDHEYAKLKADNEPFTYRGHPVSDKRHTLAWARIDLDFHNNCALIEEIQNDWLREVAELKRRIDNKIKAGVSLSENTNIWGLTCPLAVSQHYCRFVLERYTPIWDEAMLWATISFLREEIGIRHIFYHSMESGKILKHIGGTLPPRSLYTNLPRRFCLSPTAEAPEFLQQEKFFHKVLRAHPSLNFFKMSFPILQAA